jgi:DNA-binding transcriptional LysR family regulator
MVIGQLTSITAAAYIRSGKLIPILTQHVSEPANLFVYYGTRTAQPSRARAFIDLVVKRLANSNDFVLSSRELAIAATKPSL